MSDTNNTSAVEGNDLLDNVEAGEISYKTTHTAVRKARRFAVQGIYEWLISGNAPHDIAARTRADNAMHTVHLGYYHEMMRDIPTHAGEFDEMIAEHLDRDISKLDKIEHAILLIGAYEMKNSLHIPYKVVLDEAMKLNTHFGATDAFKLINAVLDKLAKQLRTAETQSDQKG